MANESNDGTGRAEANGDNTEEGTMRTTRRTFFTTAAAGAAAMGVPTVAGRTPTGPNRVIVQVGDAERTLSQGGIDAARETAYEEFLDVGNDEIENRMVSKADDPSKVVASAHTMTADGVPRSFEGSATTAAGAERSRDRALSWARDAARRTGASVELHDQARDRVTEHRPGLLSRQVGRSNALSGFAAAMGSEFVQQGEGTGEDVKGNEMEEQVDEKFVYDEPPYGVVTLKYTTFSKYDGNDIAYAIVERMNLEPGEQAFEDGGTDGWMSADGLTHHDWSTNSASGVSLEQWAPMGTTTGYTTSTLGVSGGGSVGVTGPTADFGATRSKGTTENEVEIRDESSDYNKLAKWDLEFNGQDDEDNDPQWTNQPLRVGSLATYDKRSITNGGTIVNIRASGAFWNGCASEEEIALGPATKCKEDSHTITRDREISYSW